MSLQVPHNSGFQAFIASGLQVRNCLPPLQPPPIKGSNWGILKFTINGSVVWGWFEDAQYAAINDFVVDGDYVYPLSKMYISMANPLQSGHLWKVNHNSSVITWGWAGYAGAYLDGSVASVGQNLALGVGYVGDKQTRLVSMASAALMNIDLWAYGVLRGIVSDDISIWGFGSIIGFICKYTNDLIFECDTSLPPPSYLVLNTHRPLCPDEGLLWTLATNPFYATTMTHLVCRDSNLAVVSVRFLEPGGELHSLCAIGPDLAVCGKRSSFGGVWHTVQRISKTGVVQWYWDSGPGLNVTITDIAPAGDNLIVIGTRTNTWTGSGGQHASLWYLDGMTGAVLWAYDICPTSGSSPWNVEYADGYIYVSGRRLTV